MPSTPQTGAFRPLPIPALARSHNSHNGTPECSIECFGTRYDVQSAAVTGSRPILAIFQSATHTPAKLRAQNMSFGKSSEFLPSSTDRNTARVGSRRTDGRKGGKVGLGVASWRERKYSWM